MDRHQRTALEQQLKEYWGRCALNQYLGCGFPDAEWVEQAISINYPPIESLNDLELEAACNDIPAQDSK